MAPWKTIAASFQRKRRSGSFFIWSRSAREPSLSRYVNEPEVISPRFGSRRSRPRPSVVLPQPDSPTSARDWPSYRSRSMPLTAVTDSFLPVR
jgi:hypothetical protein